MAQNTPDEEVRRTLLCKSIPPSLTKRQLLKEHFEKFGTVLKVQTSQERGAASVEFETHEQAANARRLGTSYHSNDIIITWKRRLSHSNSSGTMSKPVPPSTELFGKAISSATGVSPAVQSTRGSLQKDRGRVRLSDPRGQRLLRMGAEGSAVSQAVKRPLASRVGPMKREPMAEGLYDDLPPPSDWSEESITPTASKYTWKAKATTKSTAFGKKPATALLGKPKFGGFGVSKSDASGGQGQTDLFDKLLTAGQSSAFGAEKPVVSSGILSQNFGKSAVQATAATSSLQTSQPTLFGKTIQSGGAIFANKPLPKATSSGEQPSAISQPSEDDHSADTDLAPTLFGKSKGQRSTSPKPSIMQRLSPARLMQPRARSASPSPSGRALPFIRSVSPSPQQPAPRSLPATVGGWVMPPSLLSLAQGTANTCSERQSLLEKREKLMRQGISKQSDISRAQATNGCCPDMCPERERYLREERRRVHVFEMVPGTESHPQMDHRLAVKEYSRSSADQEEPLPLELRPADVLARTMAYLCNNILDIGSNSNWGDWYDFLWSRTRAIRKDITQQHLCSRLTAGLVEQCARFHIYCGARLVEEDAMTFDTKINNENLTKCLQTLKEMYADLLKKDIVCESEAEFRSYMVLMNLNEGDTLREVQQLRPEVRSSPEIALALSAHAAVNERNYVKFFKVVKKTSVLNACILHRYFNQMRQEALKIILKAYSAPKGPALIGLKEFVTSLHFESNEEASTFLQHYGMSSLSKDHYVEPENQMPVTRSPTLVEHKLQTSLGEAVYGGPLPPNNIPEPTTSFDSRGTFIGILQSTDTHQGGDALSTPVEEEVTPDYQLPLPSEIPNQVVKDVTKEFICKIVDSETAAVVEESLHEERQLVSYADHIVDGVVDEVVKQLLNTLATETLSEARRQEKAQIEAQRKKLSEKISLQIFTELLEEVEEDEAKAVAAQVYREVQVELMERRRRKCVDLVGEKIIVQHMDSLVKEVAEQVFFSDVVERKKTLQVAAECTKMARCRRTLRKWRAVYQKRNRLRDTMLLFPAAPPICQRKREFKVTADVVTLGKRSRLAIGPPVDMTVAVGMSAKRRQLDLMLSNAHVNLKHLLTSALASDTNDSCYMKLVVLLTDEPGAKDRQLSTWLTNKLSVGVVPEGDGEQGRLLTLTNFSFNSRNFDVCIRSYQPSVPSSGDLERTLYGTNMVVYLLPYTDQPTESYWSAVQGQLNTLLESKPEWPAVPLLVISPLDVSQSDVENQISAYLPLGVVSQLRVDALHSTLEYSTLLSESLKWLVKHRPPPLDVQLTDLTSLVESCLASLFYSKVYADMADRQMEDVIGLGPAELISFFNETLVKLVEIMCDEELSFYSWPPHEHNLSVLSVEECEKLLRDWLPLPSFDQSEGVDWQLTCDDIKGYLQTVVDHYHSSSPWSWLESREDSVPALYSRVTALLTKAESTFTTRCEKQLHHPPPLQPLRHNAPWLHIVIACVQFAISNLDSSALVMHKRLLSDLRPLAAEFHPGERIKYRDTVSAAMAAAMIEASGSEDIDTDLSIHNSSIHALSSEVIEEKTRSRQFEAYLNESLAGVEEAPPTSCGTPPSEDSTQSLDDLIKHEQEEAKTFEEFLHQSLLEEA